ncbi:DEAD/DEAH box helicase [Halorubellus sp. JP-L1]|uniref:DEAD/DEAH box helicase n=1 Tax=Halorubellus sp. JP-L1 TaxID=2715753 RepID=UPI00140B1E75|nr:DEAD/DEAH box helicase [Halorubellus sp. JP-L1]NHN41910.1 DEAD/DEAH box helicase [Halorubellus sp. JP-L1]
MDVADLPLDDEFVAHFQEQGVEELYPTQAAAVDAGVCEGERVVAAIPTASGKTFIAELAMLTSDGPALYVVPLRALATEKFDEFDALPGVSVGMATGDFDATDEDLAEHDVVVATSEKVDSAIRNGAGWVETLSCVVVDEIHLLDAEGRGPTLEVTIAKLRRLTPEVQLVGLSATVGNAGAIADWLDAALVESDWRPVDLKTGVYADDAMRFSDGEVRRVPAGDEGAARALATDVVEGEDGQCLVFVNSRRGAQDLASTLIDEFYATPADVAEEVQAGARTATGVALARCVAHGVAFHHAGLASEQRQVVERAFRDRDLKVIVATPTLAAGVNVPARRVVVRDHERWNGSEMEPLSVLEVHQMFGRAGRPHLDPYGEAVVVADANEVDDVRERYVDAEPEPVRSKLRSQRALRTHVLASVASGFADSREAILELLDETFYAHQRRAEATAGDAAEATAGDAAEATAGDAAEATAEATDAESAEGTIDDVVDEVLTYLDAVGMLERENGTVRATPLGDLVSRVYVDPVTGASVVEALERAAGLEHVTALTVLELVCDTRDMPTVYVRDDEAGQVSDAAMARREELARDVMDFDGDYQAWLDALKTALMLEDVADGMDVEGISEQYGVEPGDVRRSLERAEWLLTATESLTEHVDADLSTVAAVIRETRDELVAVEI